MLARHDGTAARLPDHTPTRRMRIRQVRPEFWSDEVVAALPDGARLFYIGLWNVADDAGWLEWRPTRIGALLYPYESAKRREVNIAAWALRLTDKGRLVIHDCGCAVIPTLPKHQRVAGKQSFTVRDLHHGKHLLATGGYLSAVDSPVEEGRGRERRGTRDFKELMTANGSVVK